MQADKINLGISVYPDGDGNAYDRLEQYINSCDRHGYTQVFASLHLPEYSLEALIDYAAQLSTLLTKTGMQLTLDISAGKLREILADKAQVRKFQNVKVDFLRLDYGFTRADLAGVREVLDVGGFVLNASTLTEGEIVRFLDILAGMKIDVSRVKACHNFYPRCETGLSMEFMEAKSRLFLKHNIPVTGCIASQANPRGPLFCGLPTVERHRYVPAARAAMELMASGVISEILFGDPFAPEQELAGVAQVVNSGDLSLHVKLCADISAAERAIVTGQRHLARPDQAEYSIRSQSSREMASFGTSIPARTPGQRQRYAVTIDNEKYSRYSGELQIILQDLPADERVNVVGHIIPEDHALVDMIKPGSTFVLKGEG